MKLWLVRHARPIVQEGICYGATDLPADPQATLEAARALAAALPTGLAVRCSPLRRCLQLAQALHALRPDLAHETDARLAEMDFGTWEGQRWDAIGRTAFEAWMADFARHRCGGGESVAVLMARVGQAMAEVRAGHRDVLWISHAGVVRAARMLARGVPAPAQASDWPADGVGFGAAHCLDLCDPGETPAAQPQA
ncbi:histidine phosphatase family protein [Ramlibacter tataouinensis]|uniref:Phosphoglycerate kinase n=1 Tax=Ramlibacter tataouinensis (strain ATCC BAA-407 / DSM 14655 / LMG 21543 / TTB310) TaxID=365046 RepID=F5Y654_RAMTT|nr:histidine phosphatase family protein [Ramlibacter tataouinensis]AEG92740.1 conserved hypothetical protein [Ramlibacter tataouinensis TTB310]